MLLFFLPFSHTPWFACLFSTTISVSLPLSVDNPHKSLGCILRGNRSIDCTINGMSFQHTTSNPPHYLYIECSVCFRHCLLKKSIAKPNVRQRVFFCLSLSTPSPSPHRPFRLTSSTQFPTATLHQTKPNGHNIMLWNMQHQSSHA